MKLYVSEPSERHAGPILVCDEAHNDIAEFYHNEHATVGQSYETALALAQKLVGTVDYGWGPLLLSETPPACAACKQLPKKDCENPSCAFRGSEYARF